MKKKLIALAALAGLGLTACSQTPTPTGTTPNGQTAVSVQPQTTQQARPTAHAATPTNHQQLIAQQQRQQQMAAQARAQQQQRLAVQQQQQKQRLAAEQQHQQRLAAQARRQQNLQIPILQHHPQAIQPASFHGPTHTPPTPQNNSGMPRLSRAELRAIGDQIFNNEGGGNKNNLVHWNVGEDFAAMGIGHFTWYPAGRHQRFGNTFPGLLDYLEQNGVQLSPWVKQVRQQGSPWRTREELERAKLSNSPQVRELTELLYQTRDLQAQYIVDRTRRAMPRLVRAAAQNQQQHVARNLNAVANTPGGWYALIDYVNFKGEGLGNGGYRGQNWGLRQVLEEMRPSQPGQQALNEFADAAMRVLHRRVQNSDPARGESRWLRGWQNRVDTYRNPIA